MITSAILKTISKFCSKYSHLSLLVPRPSRPILSRSLARFLGTKSATHQHRNMRIELLSALEDNYMYLLIDEVSNKAVCVDPVQPEKVLAAVEEHNVDLVAVLTTHHHWDHAGGNEKLASLQPNLTFYGGDDRIKPDSLHKVSHNDQFKIGTLNVKCLFTPCHTRGHICYSVTNEGDDPAVFTGDTLFYGGCGRFFEGSAEQMYEALVTQLSSLPANTRVYCGHEYTVANLKFARHVEPNNRDVLSHLQLCKDKRAASSATIPSTIGLEKQINPFMRVAEAPVQAHCGTSNPIETMRSLRTEKDGWKTPQD